MAQISLKKLRRKLGKNYNILKEREAKYASNTPLDLLNQIEDHKTAMILTEQAINGEITRTELDEALKPLLVAIMERTSDVASVTLGDVTGGIIASIIAGGDVNVQQKIYQMIKKPPLYVDVPPMPNHFVGREELVESLVGRLIAGEHLSLSAEGLAGVGKTTLAIAIVHHSRVLHHFKDGVLWVSLGPAPGIFDVLTNWIEAVGLDRPEQKTTFYQVGAKNKVEAKIVDGVIYEVKGQTRFSIKSKLPDGSRLTKFVKEDDWSSLRLPRFGGQGFKPLKVVFQRPADIDRPKLNGV